ncbi:AtzG-like protein [Asaia sp. BMEF1]|uniref:AtzG-like protein n=1 Tax=Asaia sp. BMEF1 TaxID=3155932 RepID=UPI003F67B37D
MTPEEQLEARAAALDLNVPVEYRSEIIRNLALIGQYEALVKAVDLPERLEPAFEYHP